MNDFEHYHLLMSKPVGNVSTYYLFSAICKSNHLPWQNKICPNATQFVCVRTPEHLAIAFHNGFFLPPYSFFVSAWDLMENCAERDV